jgi:hypothetical protein
MAEFLSDTCHWLDIVGWSRETLNRATDQALGAECALYSASTSTAEQDAIAETASRWREFRMAVREAL